MEYREAAADTRDGGLHSCRGLVHPGEAALQGVSCFGNFATKDSSFLNGLQYMQVSYVGRDFDLYLGQPDFYLIDKLLSLIGSTVHGRQ